jgi:acetyltransferase-like isoleucine patch superfamily enzyme
MNTLLRLLVILLPWPLKRWCLVHGFGYTLHPSSRIGLAWVFPRRLVMAAHARIGHLTVAKDMDLVALGEHASIGRLNWISGYPSGVPPHFAHLPHREPALHIGDHAAITNRHLIDCTERVTIGRFTTFAGFRSQILTHSIDLQACRQHARPVVIGEYCFVGTACTVLGGAVLPAYSVLGANSLLNKAFTETHRLYGGVPAQRLSELDPAMAYFHRSRGYVV